MKARFRKVWETLHASYWFLPTLITVAAVALAYGCLALDQNRTAVLKQFGWLYSGGPQGARSVLATIAGSIITVAATTFSVTIAVLSMAAGQFGPLLLRNFMRDRANQTVLGVFLATFLYCLLILRTVRGTDNDTYVPHLSVTIGVLLAIACQGELIFFIHHTGESIQVSHLIEVVGCELDAAVYRLFPEKLAEDRGPVDLPGNQPIPIPAKAVGYIQEIDLDRLVRDASRWKAVLQLHKRPGDYVVPGMTLAELWAPEGFRNQDAIRGAFTLGPRRTPYQDAEFAFLQLVELAVRALSPGINDPFTAIMCINRISAALCFLAARSLPAANSRDRHGAVRVIANPYRYEQLVHAALSQIRENGQMHAIVVESLRSQIDLVLQRASRGELRMALEQERAQLPGEHVELERH